MPNQVSRIVFHRRESGRYRVAIARVDATGRERRKAYYNVRLSTANALVDVVRQEALRGRRCTCYPTITGWYALFNKEAV